MTRARLAVLISGNGSNLQALIDACTDGRLAADVVTVVSNRKRAVGRQRARAAGIAEHYLPYSKGAERADYDRALADLVASAQPDVVVLAGWMHILGPAFLDRFADAVINIHPALPGQFPGVDAIARAYRAALRRDITGTGVMVHLAVPEIDAGPIIAQAAVPIDTSAPLSALESAMHNTEHRLIVEAVQRVIERRARLDQGTIPS